MSSKWLDAFCWSTIEVQIGTEATAEEKHKRIVSWAAKARGQNPDAFDMLTEWLLDDSQWREDKLAENEQLLMQGVPIPYPDKYWTAEVFLGGYGNFSTAYMFSAELSEE